MNGMKQLATFLILLVSALSGSAPLAIAGLFFLVAWRLRGSRPNVASRSASVFRRALVAVLVLASVLIWVRVGGLASLALVASAFAVWVGFDRLPILRRVDSLDESILLRWRYFPFRWCVIAELTPGVPKGRMSLPEAGVVIVAMNGRTRLFLVDVFHALTRTQAEEKGAQRLRNVAAGLTPMGTFAFPLSSKESASVLSLEPAGVLALERLVSGGLAMPEVLVAPVRGLSLGRALAYRASNEHPPRIPPCRSSNPSRTLTMELLDTVGRARGLPEPDDRTVLLDTLAAFRGAPVAEKVSIEPGVGTRVLVAVPGGSPIDLSRPQLRAIVGMYS